MDEFVFKNNMNIGNLEAETDNFLQDCFVETELYRILSDFNSDSNNFLKRIIVGRTGSGKTALLEHVKRNAVIETKAELAAETTVFEYIKNNKFIHDLVEKKVDLTIFFKSLWNHVILVKILTVLDTKKTFFDNIRKKYKNLENYLEKYEKNFFADDILMTITNNFQEGVSAEINCSGLGGVSAKTDTEHTDVLQSRTNVFINKDLLSKQKEIINYLKSDFRWDKQKTIFITIDDLDKSWITNTQVKYGFIDALLESIKEFLKLQKLKIIISIRTDILEGVYSTHKARQEEKDRSLIQPIEWTKEEIRCLLDKRITHLLRNKYKKMQFPLLKDVFNFKIKSEPADEYILNRTMLRPRDGIDFVNFCFRSANGKTEMDKNIVLEAEECYFESRKTALQNEWVSLYPEVNKYIDILLQYVIKREFSLKDLRNIKDDIYDELIKTNNMEDPLVKVALSDNKEEMIKFLLNIWFKMGVISIKKEEIIIVSSFIKSSLSVIDYENKFIIHPLFWRR